MKKQAVLIIAHNNIWTLKNIIRSLDSNYFDFFIHIDVKSDIDINKEFKDICKFSNINIYKKIDVRWADFSQVETEIFLIKKAIESNENYKFLHLISGVDMPLKNAKDIFEFFEKNSGKEFVHFASSEIPRKKLEWIKYYHPFMKKVRNNFIFLNIERISIFLQKLIHINRLKKYRNYKFMTGANWFSITNEFAKHILLKEKEIEKVFKYTRSADEIFVQTILYNSRFKEKLYYNLFDDNYISCMRYIDWNRGNPYVFLTKDYYQLLNSNFVFARKFDENIDKKVIQLIYKHNIMSQTNNME